jgi:anti-anti-sigma factor
VGDETGGRSGEATGLLAVTGAADGQVLRLSGDVDAPVLRAFGGDRALDRLPIVAVDVGSLRYIDSAGLAFLVRWAQTARREGRPAEIRNAGDRFERVLEVAGLTGLFDRA